jgi:hypothetical protein
MRARRSIHCAHGILKYLKCEQCATPQEKSKTSPRKNDFDFSQGTQMDLYQALDLTSTHERDQDFYHDYCDNAMELIVIGTDERQSSCARCGLTITSTRASVEVWHDGQ